MSTLAVNHIKSTLLKLDCCDNPIIGPMLFNAGESITGVQSRPPKQHGNLTLWGAAAPHTPRSFTCCLEPSAQLTDLAELAQLTAGMAAITGLAKLTDLTDLTDFGSSARVGRLDKVYRVGKVGRVGRISHTYASRTWQSWHTHFRLRSHCLHNMHWW